MTRSPLRLAIAALTATAGLTVPLALATAAHAATAPAASGVYTDATYDTLYDNPGLSLAATSCSDGTNGLETKGYTTLGSLPSFPYVMGSVHVAGWNSVACGTAWEITDPETGRSIKAVAVDHADQGATLSEAAMNELTDGNASELGTVAVTMKQIPLSEVGM